KCMAYKNRRAFLQNVAALPLLAVPDSDAHSTNPTQAERPPIQFDFSANLDRDEIYKFLDNSAMTTWEAPLALPKGYSQSSAAKKPVGLIDKYPDDIQSSLRGQPVRLWWARQAQCRAQQGTGTGQFVGTSEVTIPCSWQVNINVFAVLLIKNDGSVPTS